LGYACPNIEHEKILVPNNLFVRDQHCALVGTTQAQLTVQNNLTPNELVNNILVGQGVTVSNVMFNGQPANTVNDQAGSFNGATSNIGLASGLVLATGKVELVGGANNYPSLTVSPTNPNNTPDPDLSYFVNSQRCVAVLEFDFIPSGDVTELPLRFRFGGIPRICMLPIQ
jgi:hypothetical protein